MTAAANSGLANPFDQIGPLDAPGYDQGNAPGQFVTAAFVNVPKGEARGTGPVLTR
jgi:hypothetical protein